MNVFRRLVIGALLAALGLGLSLDAAEAGRVKNRQMKQKQRVKQGVRSGELTRKEVKSLRRSNRRHKQAAKNMAEDGLTVRERARIEKMQDRQSRKIYRLKHN